MKQARSNFMPSSKGLVSAACTASMHLKGAGKGPATPLTMLRENWKKASWFG